MTVIELKGKTDHEKGEHYLQLSLSALRELAYLLDNNHLSQSEKDIYDRAYTTGQHQYDEVKKIRDQLLTQKKTLRRFFVNLFVRTDARRFYKVSYETFSSIRRTSEDLTRRMLPTKNVSGSGSSMEEPVQGHVSVCEENPREAVAGSIPVTDLPPSEILRGITVEAHNEEEEQEVFATLNQIKNSREVNEEEDDDDDRTIRPKPSQSRPPSPSPSCTVIWNTSNYYIHQSVVSFDSEMEGATLNLGADGAVGSSHDLLTDTNQRPLPLD